MYRNASLNFELSDCGPRRDGLLLLRVSNFGRNTDMELLENTEVPLEDVSAVMSKYICILRLTYTEPRG